MTIFTLTSHVNGNFETVSATQRGRQIVVELPGGTSIARNVRQATELAADALGPALERAGRNARKALSSMGRWRRNGQR